MQPRDFWRIFSSRLGLACDLLIQSFATAATTETLESEKFHCCREYEDRDEKEKENNTKNENKMELSQKWRY